MEGNHQCSRLFLPPRALEQQSGPQQGEMAFHTPGPSQIQDKPALCPVYMQPPPCHPVPWGHGAIRPRSNCLIGGGDAGCWSSPRTQTRSGTGHHGVQGEPRSARSPAMERRSRCLAEKGQKTLQVLALRHGLSQLVLCLFRDRRPGEGRAL